jgi:PAS domain S-box-containing protein
MEGEVALEYEDVRTADNPFAAELREANQRLVLAAIREQELAERASLDAAQRTALIEHLQAGVLVLEPGFVIRLMNQAARELIGASPAVGTRLDELGLTFATVRGESVPLVISPVEQMLAGRSFSNWESVLVRPDGERRRVVVSGSPVSDRSGRVVHGVLVLHDVTMQRRLEEMREEYIALLSHDLRSPLSGVSLFSSLLEHVLATKGLDIEANNARRIQKNAQQLTALIQELLESTRLEGGTFALQKVAIDINALVAETCEGISPPEQGRIQTECKCARTFSADPHRIKRALTNLIVNALKYSPEDKPVQVRCVTDDKALTISVSDSGSGIAPQHLAHVFEKYYRADGSGRGDSFGLGLYIVRMIVESHGGSVWAESELGKGSTFCFSLPIEDAAT